MRYSIIILSISFLCFSEELLGADMSNSVYTDTVTVKVKGTGIDTRFEPVIIRVKPGDVIKFQVLEGGHTVTAYHPDNRRPLRIPQSAKPFDSGLLTTGEIWFLTIETAGVYDYFCIPHERFGHAGRIISGPVDNVLDYPKGRIPGAALKNLDSENIDFTTTHNQ